MENRKINIAKILRACPEGMELECTMFDNVTFELVDNDVTHPIKIRVGKTQFQRLTAFGEWYKTDVYQDYYTKCVIFPKGKTTWVGFTPPCKFKDGDIVTCGWNSDSNSFSWTCIVAEPPCKITTDAYLINDYCSLDCNGGFVSCNSAADSATWFRLATEEEKQKLFDAIKANGYKWNTETKTLEKLIEPKFKVGDKIADKTKFTYRITEITDKGYKLNDFKTTFITFEEADLYFVKVVDIFDNIILKPFDKVLVRVETGDTWDIDFFGYYNKGFYNTTGCQYKQCIPYAGNEHLLGTTEDCDDSYKTWED